MFNEKELKQRYRKRELDLLKTGGRAADRGWDAHAFLQGAKAELLARMNAFVRGIDPGEPINWKGL